MTRLALAGAVACLVAGCAPSVRELAAAQRWPEACARRAEDRAGFDRAVLAEAAARVVVDAEVLDRAALARELAVPVDGPLVSSVAFVRFAARSQPGLLRAVRVELVSLDDGGYQVFARWPVPVRAVEPEAERLFAGDGRLSEHGIAALLLPAGDLPRSPEPLSASLFDGLPVPLTGGATVRTYREQAAARAAREASSARRANLDAAVTAIAADPARSAAAARLRDHLARRDWVLLRPGGATSGRGLYLQLRAQLATPGCPVHLTLSLPLAPGLPLATAVRALFPAPRTLAALRAQAR